MKNTGKNRSHVESFSASEAASVLGVSIPTLKRMVAEGRLESFRTPGGHLRILAESVDTLREPKQERFRPVRDASPVLQNRRERLEELTLEAQEMRARRELVRLQREEQREAEQQRAEEEEREQEATERQAELELEREQLEHERARAGKERIPTEYRRFPLPMAGRGQPGLSYSRVPLAFGGAEEGNYRCCGSGGAKEAAQ